MTLEQKNAFLKSLRKDARDYIDFGMDNKTIKQNLMFIIERQGFDLLAAEKVAAAILEQEQQYIRGV